MNKSAKLGDSVVESVDAFNAAKKTAQDVRVEKERKLEELKSKVKRLREERILRHAARIQMLKKINSQKTTDLVSVLATTADKRDVKNTISNVTISKKPIQETKKYIISVPAVALSKLQNVPNGKNKSAVSQKSLDSRRSIIPKRVSMLPSMTQLPKSASYHGPKEVLNKSANLARNLINGDTKMKVPMSAYKSSAKTASHKKFDVSAIERLSKPKSISQPKLDFMPDNKQKEKKNTVIVAASSANQPKILNKRWTMASIDRLSKPKTVKAVSDHQTQSEFQFLKPGRKSMVNSNLSGTQSKQPMKARLSEMPALRRSLSTVHFKRLGADAAKKCLTRTLSSGNMKHKDIEEMAGDIFPPKEYILPVDSERKKSVKFLTPLRKKHSPIAFLHTPKLSELTSRLNDYLHKKGKSLSSFRHLNCFGAHAIKSSMGSKSVESLPAVDDENKENEDLTDDESFNEILSGAVRDVAVEWRKANFKPEESPMSLDHLSISNGIADTIDYKQLSPDVSTKLPVAVAALQELQNLIIEGYSWQHCAEWLTLIAKRVGTDITNTAAYWECRSALEEKRGDFPRAVGCFKDAIAQGIEPSQIENSLDALLVSFMELKLDPNETKGISENDSKLLEVKNVFKSTLIRFAIQEKNIEELHGNSVTVKSKYVATPVRRCSRLSKGRENADVLKKTDNLVSHNNMKNITNIKPLSPKNVINYNEKLSPEIKSTPLKTPLKQSAKKSTAKKHMVQLCSSLRNVDEKIKQDLIFVPNKALNFDDC